MRKVVVTGAGGFIGHHLVKYLKQKGYWVRGVDIKYPEFEPTMADEFILADLRFFENCMRAVQGVQDVYHLAADMGGIGYITSNHANLTRNNILIDAHMVEAARLAGVERFLYTSSACVYPSYLQNTPDVKGLKEEDAIPADPEKGYGWEKLFAEQLFTYYHEEFGLDIRIVRFHNIYGPLGTYEGGKEKAPAAIMRKVAEAEDGSEIEVWGDGKQTRSFCYIDDCVEGLVRIMDSGYTKPINLGTEELVTIDELVDIVCEVAGKRLRKRYNLSAPQGVRGRNSDNSKLREILGWEPRVSLREGIERTYPWIWAQLAKQGRAKPPVPKGAEKFLS
jgi:nucleoside-diphosphate-sugar epimerase